MMNSKIKFFQFLKEIVCIIKDVLLRVKVKIFLKKLNVWYMLYSLYIIKKQYIEKLIKKNRYIVYNIFTLNSIQLSKMASFWYLELEKSY